MNICIRQGRLFKTWLQETNRFDHINTLTVSEQRIATRIYRISLTIAIIILLVYTSLSIQQHTITIQSPSSKDFQYLQSLQLDKLSCPCRTITIPRQTFISLKPEFHSVCLSQFVTRAWSDALFFENASLYLPVDIRSTLSAQYQLLSSLCLLARQIVDDELSSFLATQFISTEVISNSSLYIQVDALTNSLKNSISSSLLLSLEFIRQTSTGNQAVSGVGSPSELVLIKDDISQYETSRVYCDYNILAVPICTCYKSYACKMPVGFYNATMPKNLSHLCSVDVSISKSLTIFDGLYAGCLPLESLLSSSLTCLYNINCLQNLQQYLALSINISILILPSIGQFNQDSTLMEIISKLFVHQWILNVSYSSFFNACAPMICSYTYSRAINFVYILATLLGFYGGLTVVLELLVLLILKYWHNRRIHSYRVNENDIMFKLRKIKKSIIELNLFAEKENFTIEQQRLMTRIFLVLFLGAILILILFSMLTTQIYTEHIYSPTQKDFERLQILYPTALFCPCSQIIIPHKQFIDFQPNFHAICSSAFVSEEWIDALTLALIAENNILYATDIRFIAIVHSFQTNSFCQLSNQTIEDLLVIFNETPFINRYILSASRLHLESNQLITTFQQSTKDFFSLQIKFIQNMFRDNQLLSGVYDNGRLSFSSSAANNVTAKFISNSYQLSNISSCSCILDGDSCVIPSSIFVYSDVNATNSLTVTSLLYGCFAIDSLFLSTFACFYDQTCLNAFQASVPFFTMTALNINETNQYTPDTKIGDIVKNLLLEKWNSFISFEKYYLTCAPQQCTYTYEKRANFLYLITTLLSLFGGLNVALRILSPFLVSLITKLFIRRDKNQTQTTFFTRLHSFILFICSLPSIVWTKFISLNLFKRHGQEENEQRIHFQIHNTRVYLCVLISALVILGVYRTISVYQFHQTISNPSPMIFEHLYNQYTDALTCPCNQVSMSYSQFIDIEYRFHSICSSNFLQQTWFNSIANINKYPYIDFRSSAISYFQILSSLCQLANDTIVNSRSSFLTQKFLSTTIISSIDFTKQIQTAIDIFQSNTRSNYIRSLQLIRDTTSGNALVTIYSSSWRYELSDTNYRSIIFTYPMTYNHENGTCSCGTNGDCSQPAAIFNNTELITIPGIRVGCYPLNSVLQSTLECLFNQKCVNLLLNIFNITKSYIPFESPTSNQFSINATIYSLADQLFIENWQTNISYEKYFQFCSASTCSYSYSQRANFIYIFTPLIGLYGGLSISLRILSPILVNVFQKLKQRLYIFRRNEILPII